MSLKAVTLIACILSSGYLSLAQRDEKELQLNAEKRDLFDTVPESHTQDDVGYADWFNTVDNANTEEENEAEESPANDQNQDFWSWEDVEKQDDDETADNDDWNWGDVEKQEDDKPAISNSVDREEEIMIQFFNHPGDPQAQEEVDWNDRDFLKEEVDKAREQGVYLDDQNDDKSMFQNDAWNSIWDDAMKQDIRNSNDNTAEEQSNWNSDDESEDNTMDENANVEAEKVAQGNSWFEEPNPANGQTFEKHDDTNDKVEDMWKDLNGVQQVDIQNKAIDNVNKEIEKVKGLIQHYEEKIKAAQEKEKLLIKKCFVKTCRPCPLKEPCTERSPDGKCRCCQITEDDKCKGRLRLARRKLDNEVEKYTKILDGLTDRLEKLTIAMQRALKNEG